MEEATRIVLQQGDDSCHDGAGWYYWEEDYPEEGSVGAFSTREEAVNHVRSSGEPIEVV